MFFALFPCLTDEAKCSFGATFHLNKTVVRTRGCWEFWYWIEVRMESEEEHTGRLIDCVLSLLLCSVLLCIGPEEASLELQPGAVKLVL